MKTFAFKQARGGLRKLDPQAVGRELESLAKRGDLTPRAVVEAARKKASILHDYFEWDNSVAGDLYREQQAGYLIRNVEVVVEAAPNSEPLRAFVHIEPRASEEVEASTQPGVYLPIGMVMRRPELRSQLLRRALLDHDAWAARYRELSELKEVFEAAERAKAEIT